MLKRGRLLLLALVALAALAVSSAAPTAVGVDTEALRQAVTTDGVKAHLEELHDIADENDGTRAVETSGYDDSVA